MKQFGEYDPVKKTYFLPTVWLSLFNALPFVGFAVGIVVGSMVSKRFGRRICMISMSAWAIMCAIIIITSKNKDQIIVGRCLNFVYVGKEISVIPVYQSEITPKKVRGLLVGTYHMALVVRTIESSRPMRISMKSLTPVNAGWWPHSQRHCQRHSIHQI